MIQEAHAPGDRVVFVDSSHGNGDGNGNSYLCLLQDPFLGRNADEHSGQYWDRHLAEDLSFQGRNQATTFVFLDACFSGGILEELVATIPYSFGTSTCSQKGYGYDESINQHGAWTNTFLTEGLERHRHLGGQVDMVVLFQNAYTTYVKRHHSYGDRPCCFLSLNGQKYNTNLVNEDPSHLPQGVVTVNRLFGF